VDEAKDNSLSDLPTYVSNNPDNVPSVRLYEGEFGVFVTMLEKLGSRLSLMESAICNVAQDIHNIRSKVASLETGVQSLQQQPTSLLQVVRPSTNNVNNSQLTNCPIASTSASQSVNITVELMTLGNSEMSTTGLVNESADRVAGCAIEASMVAKNKLGIPCFHATHTLQQIWSIRHDRRRTQRWWFICGATFSLC